MMERSRPISSWMEIIETMVITSMTGQPGWAREQWKIPGGFHKKTRALKVHLHTCDIFVSLQWWNNFSGRMGWTCGYFGMQGGALRWGCTGHTFSAGGSWFVVAPAIDCLGGAWEVCICGFSFLYCKSPEHLFVVSTYCSKVLLTVCKCPIFTKGWPLSQNVMFLLLLKKSEGWGGVNFDPEKIIPDFLYCKQYILVL